MHKNTVRVSFDVPVEEHIFLKTACVKDRVALSDYLREQFHKDVAARKKKEFHEMLTNSIKESYTKPGVLVTKEYLAKIEEELDKHPDV